MTNKNRMSYIISVVSLVVFIVCTANAAYAQRNSRQTTQTQSAATAQTASPYFTGNGGSGMRLAVLEPSTRGLAEDEQKWMPSTIQSSITGDFNRFSAMTIIDRQNFEKILEEQRLSTSGYFSDEDYIRIGHLINTRYILVGSVTRTTNAYMFELSVTDAESGERKASYPPTQISSLALENLTAVREATAVLLEQLGVRLTDQGRQELRKAPDTAAVQAEMALARGITAQRQGTEVAALSYFFQAAAMNPSLLEATNRSSILNANISSGNIGEDVRNDIVWRRNWLQRMTETEQSFAEFNRTGPMPYTLFYSDEIKQGAVNYQNETVTLSIETNLRPSHTWGRTVGLPMQKTLRAVYDGLQATQRAGTWSLDSWPRRGVTNLNSLARQDNSFTIVAELLNDQNRVIGRQSFRSDGWWEFTYDKQAPVGIRISDDVKRTVNFTVKADDITDRLTIRIASINGVDAETAARNGVLQIRAMPKSVYNTNDFLNGTYDFALGEIRGPVRRGEAAGTTINGVSYGIYIPSAIFGDPVVTIGREAFSGSFRESIYLPDSITFIGEGAFRNYNNGDYRGPSKISIGASVTIEDNSFCNYFEGAYKRNNMKAGTYTFAGSIGNGTRGYGIWRFSTR